MNISRKQSAFLPTPLLRQMELHGQEPITDDSEDYAAVAEVTIGRRATTAM